MDYTTTTIITINLTEKDVNEALTAYARTKKDINGKQVIPPELPVYSINLQVAEVNTPNKPTVFGAEVSFKVE